ncbi:Uncharacterized protein TCM_032632 [Theobroma cacao]|uniref:Uncharacterized protein n=1 Tax=Theobroma cacao TaxID=3641 RepID=A0A061FAG2_THECC|nr:Uncharacterized protein TCM_032632 [Theobroma cacao]
MLWINIYTTSETMEQTGDNGNKADIVSSRTRFLSNPAEEEGGHAVIQSSQSHLSSSVEDQAQVKPQLRPPLEESNMEQVTKASLPLPPSALPAIVQVTESIWLPLPTSAIPPAIQESPGPGLNDKAYLLKVPHQLRQVNESAYEPQLISIGPYYHGANKPHFKEMQVYKTRCLERILERNGQQSKDRFVEAMNVERARKWYSPFLSNLLEDPDNYKIFEENMLLDGCFIVELLSGKVPGDDPFFKLKWVLNALYHDLLLFENQLPFFVLVGLYHVIKDPTDGKDFACHAFSVLSDFLPGPKKWNKNPPTIKDTDNIKHLLSLVHDNWSPSPQGIRRHQHYQRTKKEKEKIGEEARKEGGLEKWKFTLCALEKPKEKKFQGDEESGVTKGTNHNFFKWKLICCAREKENLRKGLVEWQSLRCATELEEAGIQFMNGSEESGVKSLFDISFTDATMKIPTFVVEDYTERLFRNLIAYELYEEGSTYVIDYVTLMDNLINSAKDVQLLRFHGIIENMLGNDEAVAQMLNKLRDHVMFCGDTFYYEEIFVDVKTHCARRWNTWKAKLKKDYFNSPWASVSFFAAFLIILLAMGQFITGVIPLKG